MIPPVLVREEQEARWPEMFASQLYGIEAPTLKQLNVVGGLKGSDGRLLRSFGLKGLRPSRQSLPLCLADRRRT